MTFFTINLDDSNGDPIYWATSSLTLNAGYQTLYNAMPMGQQTQGPQPTPGPDNSESYAFNIFANAMLTFQHEAMTSYMGTYDFTFQLLNFTPYGQTIAWNRFDAMQGFGVHGAGFRDLQIGYLKTRVRENAKTCKWSALTNSGNMTPVCAYDPDRMTDYIDPVWKFNAGGALLNAMNMGNLMGWYGPGTYYMF